VPEAYTRAVREHELTPVDRPEVEVVPPQDDGPMRIKAHVAVRPTIELGGYTGIALDAQAVEVSEADVERSVLALARERATLVPVDRPAKLGDYVVLDYEGRVNGTAFEGGKAEAQTAELSEERFIPGFASGIAGMRAGESKEVLATFPQQYGKAELAGQEARFSVTLHEVKEPELPTIDDEFARSVSSNDNVADLRADVQRRLEAMAKSRSRKRLERVLIDKLMEVHDFPLPAVMIEREVENLTSESQAFASRMGLSWDDYLARTQKSEEQLRSELRSESEKRVKATLLLEAIAKTENIRATPADVQLELAALAEQYGQPADRIRQALGNNLLSLMDGIVRSKTMDWLIEHANISTSANGA